MKRQCFFGEFPRFSVLNIVKFTITHCRKSYKTQWYIESLRLASFQSYCSRPLSRYSKRISYFFYPSSIESVIASFCVTSCRFPIRHEILHPFWEKYIRQPYKYVFTNHNQLLEIGTNKVSRI